MLAGWQSLAHPAASAMHGDRRLWVDDCGRVWAGSPVEPLLATAPLNVVVSDDAVPGMALAGCGDGEGAMTEEEQALLADERYGEVTFDGASVGGVMQIDDDLFRLGVVSADGEVAQLEVIHSQERELNRVVDVELGSVFAVGDHPSGGGGDPSATRASLSYGPASKAERCSPVRGVLRWSG